MGNRSLFAIYTPDGQGIRSFDTNNNVGVGWFILLDPPEEADSFSVPLHGRDLTKVFLACQSNGERVAANWKRLQGFLGKHSDLDNMIGGCEALVEAIHEYGTDVVYSVDIGEYHALGGDELFVTFLSNWRLIHEAMRSDDWKLLLDVLENMVVTEWIGKKHQTDGKRFSEGMVEYFKSNKGQSPWSIAMCGWSYGKFLQPPIMMGWGTGIVDPADIKENMFPSDEDEELTDEELEQEWERERQERILKRRIREKEEAAKKRILMITILVFVVVVIVGFILFIIIDSQPISPEEYADGLQNAEEGDAWKVSGTIGNVTQENSVIIHTFEGTEGAYFNSYEQYGNEGDEVTVNIEYRGGNPWQVDHDVTIGGFFSRLCSSIILCLGVGFYRVGKWCFRIH